MQRVIIPHPGVRPGQPGSQISVPLATLQSLQVCDWSMETMQAFDWSRMTFTWSILSSDCYSSTSRLVKESPQALPATSSSRQSQVRVIVRRILVTRSHVLLTLGQYQILRVGPPGATGATTAVSAASQPSVAGNFQFCSLLIHYTFLLFSISCETRHCLGHTLGQTAHTASGSQQSEPRPLRHAHPRPGPQQ